MKVITEELKLVDLFPDEAGKQAQRLHIKKNEIPFIRKSYLTEKSDVNKGERAVVSYISTTTKDRDGDQLLPEGALLDNYRKNPVVLWGHDYRGTPVGKNAWIKPDEKGLIAKTVFAKNEKADELFRAYTEDIGGTGPLLAGWSVGFIPVEWEDTETKELEKNKDLPKRIYKKWELLEYSAVPIPSCPEALTLAVEKGLIPKGLQKDLEKLIEVEDFQTEPDKENEAKTMTPDELKEHYRKQEEDGKEVEVVPDEEEKEIEVVLKPETTESYHRIPVDTGSHDGHRIRTITISASKGIKALYCGTCKKVITYLFDVNKWTMEEARAWVSDHKRLLERYEEKLARDEEEQERFQETVNELFELGVEDIEELVFDEYKPEEKQEEETEKDGKQPDTVSVEAKELGVADQLLFEVKALQETVSELKEGRVLSRKNREVVKAAVNALMDVLKADSTGSREDEDKESVEEEEEKTVEIEKDERIIDRDLIQRAIEKAITPEKFQDAIDIAIKKLKGKVE